MHVKFVLITANPLPNPIGGAAAIPFDNTFLLIGGLWGNYSADAIYLKDIYRYNGSDDKWIKLDSELKTGRYDHVALLVPQPLFPKCDSPNGALISLSMPVLVILCQAAQFLIHNSTKK